MFQGRNILYTRPFLRGYIYIYFFSHEYKLVITKIHANSDGNVVGN